LLTRSVGGILLFPVEEIVMQKRRSWWVPLLFLAAATDIRAEDKPEVYGVEAIGHACIALAVFGEARGESWLGQALVAQVILNRLRQNPDRYADPCDVVNDRDQFHAIRDWSFPRNPRADDERAWITALEVTQAVTMGDYVISPPACAEATHFHHVDNSPAWAAGMAVVCEVDNHRFLRE
jgi:spore germination cell wall hydrolase CwlJ-like protein